MLFVYVKLFWFECAALSSGLGLYRARTTLARALQWVEQNGTEAYTEMLQTLGELVQVRASGRSCL